jgi:hypothetical protein
LVQLAQQDQQALKEYKDLKVFRDLKVFKDLMDHREQQAQLAHKGYRVSRD